MGTTRANGGAASGQGLLGDRRLVLVSNREPYVRKRGPDGKGFFERTTGGLVTALDPVMRRCGGVWLAWDPGGDPKAQHRFEVPERGPTFTLRQVPLTSREVRRYYFGFANRALWPLCHYFIDRCHFDEAEWHDYVAVNERFADATAAECEPGDLIWVHDYHFCLLPKMIRERRPKGLIAYFLHIPFPADEVFHIIPWRAQILEGLLGADLVGMHTSRYVADFLACCERLLGARVDYEEGLVHWQGRRVKVAAFPIGIDVDEFERIAASPEVEKKVAKVQRGLRSEISVLGVDRLDYSKGIPQRLFALERFLERYPEYHGRFAFVQVAVPSRTRVDEYRNLKRSIDEMVGRINGRFSDSGWQPIRYLYRSLNRQDLVAHYRAADVAMITPLRDGMNLVAKEYCASRTDEGGILLLSEFTGAAEGLGEGALLVNPFSVEGTAEALHRAFEMPADERRRRMASMRAHVRKTDINIWLHDILRAATGVEAAGPTAKALAREEAVR
jgi:alpha,alpha-trehalose-phosphate synthase [UDP-forming]